MISSQAQDLASALAKSLGLDDQSCAETYPTNGCEPLDGLSDKEVSHLKVRVHLHDDEEFHFPAVEPAIDADTRQAVHKTDHGSVGKRALGWRLVRTVAFGVLASLMVSAVYAWLFYSDVHRTQTAGTNVASVELASKIPDRVPILNQAAVPVLWTGQTADRLITQDAEAPVPPTNDAASGQMSVFPGSSPDLRQQIDTLVSDVAVVRRIVERLAAVQEQMAIDIAMLQKTGQKAVPAPSRKYAPNIARSDVVAHSPSVPVPAAPAPTPLAPH